MTAQLTLPIQGVPGVVGDEDIIERPGEGVGELDKQGGHPRCLPAHLLDVVGVVDPDADDLAGMGDDGARSRSAKAIGSASLEAISRHSASWRSEPTSA